MEENRKKYDNLNLTGNLTTMKDMLGKIQNIEKSYVELGEKLSDPEIIKDYEEFKKLSKTRKSMEETVEIYHAWQAATKAKEDALQMIKA